jgi:hypothetical protein
MPFQIQHESKFYNAIPWLKDFSMMKPKIFTAKKENISCISVSIDQYCILAGVHLTLYDWLHEESSSWIRKKLFNENGLSDDDLLIVLGLRNEWDRIIAAQEFMSSLWHACPELGPLPFQKTFYNLQRKRYFYSDYRDHIRHSLLVFLLGLYLYEKLEPIKNSIDSSIKDDPKNRDFKIDTKEKIRHAFFFRWLIITLYHDIGYVFEHEKGDEKKKALTDNIWKDLADEANKVFSAPLSYTFPHKNPEKYIAVEENIANNFSLLSRNKLTNISDMGKIFPTSKSKRRTKDLLADIDGIALVSGLADKKHKVPILRQYFLMAHEYPLNDRNIGYWDHGISSAILLMQTWRAFIERCEGFKKNKYGKFPRAYIPKIESILNKENYVSASINDAASAIALHNITHKDFVKQHASALNYFSLSAIDRFKIPLKSSTSNFPTAIAFLLKLSDTLQNWDRPPFRDRDKKDIDTLLVDCDVSLQYSDSLIHLGYSKDHDQLSESMKSDLSVLNTDDIQKIIKYNNSAFKEETEELSVSDSQETVEESLLGGDELAEFLNEYDSVENREKIISLTGEFEKIEGLNLHLCKLKPEENLFCPYNVQLLMVIAEILRSNQAYAETRGFYDLMNEISSHSDRIIEILDGKVKLKLKSAFSNLIYALSELIHFFLELKRDYKKKDEDEVRELIKQYKSENDKAVKKEILNDFSKKRIKQFIDIRVKAQPQHEKERFIESILTLFFLKSDYQAYSEAQLEELLNTGDGYHEALHNLGLDWISKIRPAFQNVIQQRTTMLLEQLSGTKSKEAFKTLKLSKWTGGKDLDFPHLSPHGYRIWKQNP